ncbi:hypothetical protein PD5205_00573 [Xanthomonas fragariae]|uniref:Uncharacterized protein n=1 Tax=Xanthomonas fragariae TaxID=48664 RepID=A0A1Y6HKF6_9XANT|nr:hypothetical protein PD5205_00573 [Xanthomonas fragariae]
MYLAAITWSLCYLQRESGSGWLAVPFQPCRSSHAGPAMPVQPCRSSHAGPAMPVQPCRSSHAGPAIKRGRGRPRLLDHNAGKLGAPEQTGTLPLSCTSRVLTSIPVGVSALLLSPICASLAVTAVLPVATLASTRSRRVCAS